MRICMRKLLLVTLGIFLFTSQGSYEDYKRSQNEAFSNYVDSITSMYVNYEMQEKQAFEDYKRKVLEKWDEFKSSTNKIYVNYSENMESRISVDYEAGTLLVEVVVDSRASKDDAREKIIKATKKVIKTKAGDGSSIVNNQIKTDKGITVKPSNIEETAEKIVKQKEVTSAKTVVANDGVKRKKYRVEIPLVKNHLSVRAEQFKDQVYKNSKRFDLDPAIVFAIIETESSFNPKARSHIPAYGLMQLVPKSGARDAYLYLYKEDKFLNKGYLYNPAKNIELGCAYLAKIRYVYFKDIRDDKKAFICAIPAYNTGIGNVSKTLSNTSNLSKASEAANRLDFDRLYNKLKNELKYEEARNYLVRVWERKDKYKS